MNIETREIAGLQCTIVDALPENTKPSVLCVLNHGYGAGGDDLVSLGPELITAVPGLADSVGFVFPAAPLSLAEKGYPETCRAWWHLDMEKITAAVASGQLRDQRNDLPPELPAAREALQGVVAQLKQEYDLAVSQIVLGGFSQGAMLATDVALRSDETLGGLVVWSGTLLCESEWRRLVPNHKTLRVLQTHGEYDMVLPYVAAEWLRDMWSDCGIDAEFISFPGVHTIPREGLVGLIRMLQM